MWLLVSTASDLDSSHNHVSTSRHWSTHTDRSWRLALLVKNSIFFGSTLDPRCYEKFHLWSLKLVCHVLRNFVILLTLFFTISIARK